MNSVLGIDLGTTLIKIGIINRQGKLTGLTRIPVPIETTKRDKEGSIQHYVGDRAELSTDNFISLLRTGIASTFKQAGVRQEEITSVSYSSQANSFLLLDDSSKPLTPIILWSDQRASADTQCRDLWQHPEFLATTGTGVYSELSAVTKIRWIIRFMPGVWKKTRMIMTISDYLVYLMTGLRSGDQGTASLLGLWDVRKKQWWSEALDILEIPESFLSAPFVPGEQVGTISRTGSECFPLPINIPVFAGSLDHHVSSLGAGAGSIARACDSTGTVLACVIHSDNYDPAPKQCLGAEFYGSGYYKIAFTENGAHLLTWYRDSFAPAYSLHYLTREAGRIAPGSHGLIAKPFSDRCADLSGFLFRFPYHTHAHYIRALMESVSASLVLLLSELFLGRMSVPSIAATGGGARSDVWLSIKSNMTGLPFIRTAVEEPACFGAGMLAAVGRGWFGSLEEAGKTWITEERIFYPLQEILEFYREWLNKYFRLIKDFPICKPQ